MSEETNTVSDVAAAPINEKQINLSGDRGVLKEILSEGEGEETPYEGCTASLHYTGRLVDGTVFDSSIERKIPFEFEVGKRIVIRAFDMCIMSMKKGEKAILTCAPEYGYGSAGQPPNIPANATIIFELELLGWKPPDISPNNDGGIEKHTITKGPEQKKKNPQEGCDVKVHLVGKYNDKVFDERDVDFSLGEVGDDEVVSGIQIALKHFNKGETARLVIKPKYAFGAEGNEKFNIPPNATVEYIVTLIEFEKPLKKWTLSNEDNIEQAKLSKEKGTAFLKDENYDLAIKLYTKANGFLDYAGETEDVQQMRIAVHLNLALTYQKLDDVKKVQESCDLVLEKEPNNIKALYRRGSSFLKSGETDKAFSDFKKITDVEPQNKAALSQIAACKKIMKEYNDKEKKLYSNMFTKFAIVDNEKEENNRNEDVLTSCGEWNMEEEARKEADRAFKEVDQNVVMI